MAGAEKVPLSGLTLEEQVLFALRERRELTTKLTLGVAGYSSGHTLLALSAGLVARAWGKTPLDPPFVPGMWSFDTSIATASYVGLAAAIVKALSGALLASSEKRLAGAVSGSVRAALVCRFLATGTRMPAPAVLALLAVRLREIERAVVDGVLGRARSLTQLLPLALCLFALSPGLALAASAVIAPFALALTALRRRTRHATARAQSTVEELEQNVDELVRNVDLFRAYGAGRRAIDLIARSASEATSEAARLDATRAIASGFNEIMAALAVVGVVFFAGRSALPAGSAALVPFAAVFFMAYRPLRDLGDARAWLERGNVALEAVSEAMRRSEETVRIDEALDSDQEAMRADWFRTAGHVDRPPGGRRAPQLTLSDFGGLEHGGAATLRLAPGEIVCLVGPTGSGKTTLLRAMLGLEPARGRLGVDGRDVTYAPSGPDSRPFAWVPQEAPIVTATVHDNVALFGGADRAYDALRLVGAESIAGLTEVVGAGGRPLSGGERRLLSLARAFATELPVLLLDEPTEGLDADATARVIDAIERLRGRRSVLVATHRTEVMQMADRVVEMRGNERVAAE